MTKPRLLDLYCCAGGAAVGYARAGFDVVGVDFEPQRNYPFAFVRADVLTLDDRFLRFFDAIHASPPCQGYSAMRHAPGAKGAPQLIAQTRALLRRSGRPWVIENVEEAGWAMERPITLCGSMFGLRAQGHQLRRHRLFETSFPVTAPLCAHSDEPVIGIYGGHARRRAARHGGRGTKDEWEGGHRTAASAALGIDWATLQEMSESVPPAYTEWLGGQLLAHIEAQRTAA